MLSWHASDHAGDFVLLDKQAGSGIDGCPTRPCGVQEKQGISERKSANNHGTYYDIQVAALAAFVDDPATYRQTVW